MTTESMYSIITLDDAHEILSALGIGPSSRGYQRWRRDDGFRRVDLEDVLDESPCVLGVDWRDSLSDPVERIIDQLAEIGLAAIADLVGEDQNEGTITIGDQVAKIKYVTRDNDDFDDVIAAINRLMGSNACYRKFRSCEGADGWSYAVLKNEDWKALASAASSTVDLLWTDARRA
ncbi:MAG: hypothetical protein ACKVT0_03125 [Planctomycetaceae bacterium]